MAYPDVYDQNITHLFVWDGNAWVAMRTPSVFKTLDLSGGTAETTIWTPATGKKFRLMGGMFNVPTGVNISFIDGVGGSTILFNGFIANVWHIIVGMGNGILSTAADNPLRITRSGSVAITGTVWGTEE